MTGNYLARSFSWRDDWILIHKFWLTRTDSSNAHGECGVTDLKLVNSKNKVQYLSFWYMCDGWEAVFTALHVMQTRYCDEYSVCRLSVCPSVTRVYCDKMIERYVQVYIPHERTFSLVFLRRRMVGGGRPLLREILGQLTPIWAKTPIFNQ